MPLPVRPLPVIQKWDCHGCSDCCRTYAVRVSDEERDRIDGQNWDADPAMKGVLPVVFDPSAGGYRLNHTADGACVFLGPDNRCRIHAKFGSAAKPMACRLYPFVLVPAGDHWRVGIRFSCPSAADNKGRPLAEHAADLKEYAGLLEADAGAQFKDRPVPPLQPGQVVSWADLLRFTAAILKLLRNEEHPIERRLRMVAGLIAFCEKAAFEKVTGERLNEFLEITVAMVEDDVPADPYAVPKPGWVGRMLFRQVLALYARKDNGPNKGVASRGRWTRLKAGWRFARGRGRVPKLHGLFPETTFAVADTPAGELTATGQALLTRYYTLKVESLQFVGPTNYHRPFWLGLQSLLLTFPVVMWLTRVFASDGRDADESLREALRLVDDSFGFNKLLGTARQNWALRTMATRGEIPRLIAWYAR